MGVWGRIPGTSKVRCCFKPRPQNPLSARHVGVHAKRPYSTTAMVTGCGEEQYRVCSTFYLQHMPWKRLNRKWPMTCWG